MLLTQAQIQMIADELKATPDDVVNMPYCTVALLFEQIYGERAYSEKKDAEIKRIEKEYWKGVIREKREEHEKLKPPKETPDIKPPIKPLKKGRPPIYFFNKLEIGDVISVPASQATNVKVAASNYKKRHPGWNYTSATQTNGGMKIVRIA